MRLDGSGQKRPITPQSSNHKQAAHNSAVRGAARQSPRQQAIRAAKEDGKPAQNIDCSDRPDGSQRSRWTLFSQPLLYP